MEAIARSDYSGAASMATRSGSDKRQIGGRGDPRPRRIGQEEVEQFRELHRQGLTGNQITKLTGWGRSAVYKRIQIKRMPRWTEDDNQALVDCYADGGDKKALAARMGRSVKAVHIAMCRYRKAVRKDPKKRRTLGVMTWLLRKMKAADIYKELEGQDDTNTTDPGSRPKNGNRAHAN